MHFPNYGLFLMPLDASSRWHDSFIINYLIICLYLNSLCLNFNKKTLSLLKTSITSVEDNYLSIYIIIQINKNVHLHSIKKFPCYYHWYMYPVMGTLGPNNL